MGILENRTELRKKILTAIETLTERKSDINFSNLAKLCGCTKRILRDVHMNFIKSHTKNFKIAGKKENSLIEETTTAQFKKLEEFNRIPDSAFGREPEKSYWNR